MVDQAFRSARGADTLVDDHHHLEDAWALDERVDAIADLDLGGGFGGSAVHADVPTSAGDGGRRPALVEPDRPKPDVYPRRFDDVILPEP